MNFVEETYAFPEILGSITQQKYVIHSPFKMSLFLVGKHPLGALQSKYLTLGGTSNFQIFIQLPLTFK